MSFDCKTRLGSTKVGERWPQSVAVRNVTRVREKQQAPVCPRKKINKYAHRFMVHGLSVPPPPLHSACPIYFNLSCSKCPQWKSWAVNNPFRREHNGGPNMVLFHSLERGSWNKGPL